MLRGLVFIYLLFPPACGRLCISFPGLGELAAGAQGCQGGGRHGRAGVGTGTATGVALLPRTCSLKVPSWGKAAVGVGNGALLLSPPPPLNCLHLRPRGGRLDPRAMGMFQARGLFRNTRERWGETLLMGPTGAPWGRGDPRGDARALRVCGLMSLPPPPPSHAAPRTSLAPRGFCLRCCWGHVVVSLGIGVSPAEVALQISGVSSVPG